MASDQKTPDPHVPEQDQTLGADAEATSQTVSTPEPDAERVAEAGNAYTGRQLDDTLKAHPRVEDADRALVDDDEDE